MKKEITGRQPYNDPVIEQLLQTLTDEAQSAAILAAKEWGEKKEELTAVTANIICYKQIKQLVKTTKDKIRMHIALKSIIYTVQQVEEAVKKGVEKIGKFIAEKRELLNDLLRQIRTLRVNPKDLRSLRRFQIFAWCIGIADGGLAFSAFFASGYGLLGSLISGALIMVSLSVSHRAYAPWIRTAPTVRKRNLRIAIVLVAAAIYFSVIGLMRAWAIIDVPDTSLEGEYVATVHVPPFIGWVIAATSWIAFLIVFFLALKYWRSKEQEIADSRYQELTKQSKTVDGEITALEQECVALEQNAGQEKRDAVARAEYLKAALNQCTNTGYEAINTFQRLYPRYHGSAPDHFNDPVDMDIDDSFNIVDPKNEKRA